MATNGSDTLWWARINECKTPDEIRTAIAAMKERRQDAIQQHMQEELVLRELHKEDIRQYGRAIRLMEEKYERAVSEARNNDQ